MAKNWIALVDFIGARDDLVLEPAALDFTMKPWASGCRTCLFDRQSAAVCNKAGEKAKKQGMRDCQDGFIYVLAVRDKRQISIEGF